MGDVGRSKWLNLLTVDWLEPEGMPTVAGTATLIDRVLRGLAAPVAAARAAGLMNRSYVYGFDERHEDWTEAINQTWSAVKKAYPDLRTVSTLNWHTMPLSMRSLDVWVDGYWNYPCWCEAAWGGSCASSTPNTTHKQSVDAWRALADGREYFQYWCLSPGDGRHFLNSFVEWPALKTRLIFWNAARLDVRGMLYW